MDKTWNVKKQAYDIFCPLCGEEFDLPADAVTASDADPAEWLPNAIVKVLEKELGHNCRD